MDCFQFCELWPTALWEHPCRILHACRSSLLQAVLISGAGGVCLLACWIEKKCGKGVRSRARKAYPRLVTSLTLPSDFCSLFWLLQSHCRGFLLILFTLQESSRFLWREGLVCTPENRSVFICPIRPGDLQLQILFMSFWHMPCLLGYKVYEYICIPGLEIVCLCFQTDFHLPLYTALVRPHLSPTLSSSGLPLQERWRPTGESPAEGYEDEEGTGASLLQEEAEGAGLVQPGEEKAERGP